MTEPSGTEGHSATDDTDGLEELAQGKKRGQKKVAIAGAALVVAALGGVFALTKYQTAQADAEIGGAWGSFSACLFGSEPLAPGETASQRLRAIQLKAMTLPEAQRAPDGGKPWPDRCTNLGHALHEAIKNAGRAQKDGKDLAHYSEALAKLLKEPTSYAADLSEAADGAWESAAKEGVKAAPNKNVAPPPPAAKALTVDALAKIEPLSKTSFNLKSLFTEPHPGGPLRILIDEKGLPGSPFICTFSGGGAAAAAKCASLPPALAQSQHGYRLLGTSDDDAAPLVFAGKRGSSGVYRADSAEPIASIYSYGGYSAKDGSSAVLGWNEAKDELMLIRKPAGGAKQEKALKPDFRLGNFYYSAQVLWDHVLLRGVTKEEERRLFAQTVARASEEGVGELTNVGELPEAGLIEGGPDEPPHIAGCRTKEALIVRVKGYNNEFMSFLVGGKWSEPILVPSIGGTLSCRKAEAAITRVDVAGLDAPWKTSVVHRRCTSAGCNFEENVRMEPLLNTMFDFAPREARVIGAADVEGKLLLVWAAGERGGVRMRLAPADQMMKAEDVILFDDLVKDGKVQKLSTLFDLRVLSREGFGIVVLSTVAGIHAVRVDPDGKTAPVAIEWAK
jgi:hypothetical protein